jgi:hypothetical protein
VYLWHSYEYVTSSWRKLYNEELHNLYSSPNIRMIKWGKGKVGYVTHTKYMRNAYEILDRKPDGKNTRKT